MTPIAIVTDTDSSLPANVAARHGIRQAPITIHFGDQSFETGVDIDDAAMFARIDRDNRLPTTAAPTPGKYAEAYQAAFDAGASAVVCFCVSSKVSAAYAAAVAARDLLPGRNITVVDSLTLTLAQGFMSLAAAEAAAAGATLQQTIARAADTGSRTHLFGALATLKYLAMSGRVGHLAAGMAGLLDVKPLVTIQDGKLELLERVRTQRRVWQRAIDLTVEKAAGRAVERAGIVHARAAEDARAFEALLRAALPCPADIMIAELTPGLSVHAGAGMVGAVVVLADGSTGSGAHSGAHSGARNGARSGAPPRAS